MDILIKFCEACEFGNLQEMNRLIELGAYNFNAGLWSACSVGNLFIVNTLIKLGANDFDSGLDVSCRNEQFNCAKLMVRLGATFKNGSFINNIYKEEWYNEQIEIEQIISKFIGPDIVNIIVEYM